MTDTDHGRDGARVHSFSCARSGNDFTSQGLSTVPHSPPRRPAHHLATRGTTEVVNSYSGTGLAGGYSCH
jgi:hypothetical protein